MVILIVISFALEAFIIELYCRKSFTAKVRLDKRLIVYTVIYGVLTALYSEEVFFRNVLLEVIAGAFIMYFLFENSVISAIKNSIILMIVNNASKILVGEISAHIDDGFLYGHSNVFNSYSEKVSRKNGEDKGGGVFNHCDTGMCHVPHLYNGWNDLCCRLA